MPDRRPNAPRALLRPAPPQPHQRLLVVLHQETSSPGRVGQILMHRGFHLDIRRPPMGDPLPATLENHSGVVIFGGPMSANDPDEYIAREIDFCGVALKEEKPFLGICLGAQMLVKQCGGQVCGAPCGGVEMGWYPLEATEAGRALLDWPSMVYQFHREGFDLPRGFELHATASLYPNQAYKTGKCAYGVQFHGELTEAMMRRWAVKGAHRFDMPNAQKGHAHLDGRLMHDVPLRRWMENYLDLIFGRPVTA